MGATLPKAVEAAVVERHAAPGFRVGMAELNGWRTNMEDAHVVLIREDWAFFGVFDGHGGEACSAFVAKRLKEELEKSGCPADDAAVKKLVLDVDKEFLDSGQASGSTATMCIVHKPSGGSGKHVLRVANAGDSRILLGRRDGTIVDGGGTDQGLTTDHKPDHPDERERIYRCGGKVEKNEGNVARVNGDLAVSRGFGDRTHKQTGGPGPEDRPVTADPEFGRFECDEADFLLLVCDGVSEGDFPNPEVVKLVASLLKENGDDAGAAARAVCHKAVEQNSQDNISCMIVLFQGSAEAESKSVEFFPGPVDKLGHKGFRKAYEAMVERAGLTLGKAVEQRYEVVKAEMQANPTPALREESEKLGTAAGAEGSEERAKWAEDWLDNLPPEEDSGPGGMDMASLLGKGGGGMGEGKGKGKGGGKSAPEPEDKEIERDEGDYSWSQKGEEVQVVFKLPKPATKKDVKVTFKPSSVNVAVHGSSLLDGLLGGKVDVDECTWCLASAGAELQVMFTKKDAKDNWTGLVK